MDHLALLAYHPIPLHRLRTLSILQGLRDKPPQCHQRSRPALQRYLRYSSRHGRKARRYVGFSALLVQHRSLDANRLVHPASTFTLHHRRDCTDRICVASDTPPDRVRASQ